MLVNSLIPNEWNRRTPGAGMEKPWNVSAIFPRWLQRGCLYPLFAVFLIFFAAGVPCWATTQPTRPPASAGQAPSPTIMDPSGVNPVEPNSPWQGPLRQAIQTGPFEKPEVGRLALWYDQNGWRPFFIAANFSFNAAGSHFFSRIQTLAAEGFDPKQFPLAELHAEKARLEALRTENPTQLTTTPVAPLYAMQSQPTQAFSDHSRFRPTRAGQDQLYHTASQLDSLLLASLVRWIQDMNPFATFAGAKTLRQYPTLASYLDSLKPKTTEYSVLQHALERYLSLSQDPSIATVPPLKGRKSLRHGAQGKQVENLQIRLATEGYYQGEINALFDDATEQAVKIYQQQHLLVPDGVVGRRTKAWLNTSYAGKARLIAESLRALRHSQSRLHDHYLQINIPEYMLRYFRNGQLVEQHKIVVGRSTGRKYRTGNRWVGENHTPSLTSSIRRIIINPRWYVPERIRRELDKKIEEDPEYLNEHGFIAMNSEYSFGEPRIYQQPGPGNSLGKVKFEFPNRYSVYLHDTPQKRLFQKIRRDFSHGCIRVDQAVALAKRLLRDDNNPVLPKLDRYLRGSTQRSINLITPVPIIVEYRAVSVTQEGQLIFCGDPYGRVIANRGRGFPL